MAQDRRLAELARLSRRVREATERRNALIVEIARDEEVSQRAIARAADLSHTQIQNIVKAGTGKRRS